MKEKQENFNQLPNIEKKTADEVINEIKEKINGATQEFINEIKRLLDQKEIEKLVKEKVEKNINEYYEKRWGELQDNDEEFLKLSDSFKQDFHSAEIDYLKKNKDYQKSFDIEKIKELVTNAVIMKINSSLQIDKLLDLVSEKLKEYFKK